MDLISQRRTLVLSTIKREARRKAWKEGERRKRLHRTMLSYYIFVVLVVILMHEYEIQ